MELIPIVYISLAVFSVIAVVVVIISYISFKVRQKYGDDNDGEIIVDLKPSTVSPTKKAIEKKRKESRNKAVLRRKAKPKLDKKKNYPYGKATKKSTMNRIEIINPAKFGADNNPKKNKKTLTGENDILNHYSEEDDDDFFTIKGTKSD